MGIALFIDFDSTYTKVAAIDLDREVTIFHYGLRDRASSQISTTSCMLDGGAP